MIITKDKVIEICFFINEFNKNFDLELKKNLLPPPKGINIATGKPRCRTVK